MVTATLALRAHGLRVAFGGREGLASIDLEVAAGERLALLGPSGGGKTSLLRSLAGLQPVLGGRIEVDGRDVTALPPEQRGVVYMHQTPSLFPHLSVVRNVMFPLEVRGREPSDAARVAHDWLARVRLDGFADRATHTLSGGQRHRVALARALAAAPRALLLDEPFASLDPSLRGEVRDAVTQVLRDGDGPAVIVVTHDVDEAAALGDRVSVLIDGGLAQSGTPAEVFAHPASLAVARFLGTTNLVEARRDEAGVVHSVLGKVAAPGPAGTVHLAVRPGHVRLQPSDGAPGLASSGLCAAALVESVMERVSGSFVRLRWRADVSAAPWSALVSGVVPSVGTTVTVAIDARDVHVIEHAPNGRADVR